MLDWKGMSALPGLLAVISAAGHFLAYVDGVPQFDVAAVQAIINAYDPLPEARVAKITAIKEEGLARINTSFPALSNFDQLDVFDELWRSLSADAKSASATWARVVAIREAAGTAIQGVNAASSMTAVNAVSAVWPQ